MKKIMFTSALLIGMIFLFSSVGMSEMKEGTMQKKGEMMVDCGKKMASGDMDQDKMMKKGEEMMEEGEKMVKKGEKYMKDDEKKAKGMMMKESGQMMVDNGKMMKEGTMDKATMMNAGAQLQEKGQQMMNWKK
jgi:hypothetical protein